MRIRDDVTTGSHAELLHERSRHLPQYGGADGGHRRRGRRLDSMLSKVADFYEEEVDNAVDDLSSLLEPMIMVVLGVLIGGLVIAMYLPIFKMGEAV